MRISRRLLLVIAMSASVGAAGCSAIQQLTALRSVDFSLAGVSDGVLAGIALDEIGSWRDLSLIDAGRLAVAVTEGNLPMQFNVLVQADNPVDNPTARMTRMDWTVLLEEREALSGAVTEEVVLPSGEPTMIPIAVSVNLIDFFEGNAQDLFELARSLSGRGGAPKQVAVRASPVITTPLGAIRYPRPITIVDRQVGGSR